MQQIQLARVGRLFVGILTVLLIAAPSAWSQMSDPGQIVTPEDMVEDAIKKIDNGDLADARRLFEQVRRIKPDLLRLKLVHGLLLIEGGSSLEALPLLEDFNKSREAGNEWRGYAAVGRVYMQSRSDRMALRPLERAKDFAPVELYGRPIKAEIATDLAQVLNRLKRTRDALKVADEAASLAPNDAGIQLKLARMHMDNLDYPAALRTLDRSISLVNAQLRADPFKPEENMLLKQTHDLKVSIYRALREANPDDATVYMEIGRAMRAQSDAEHRIRVLTAREFLLEAVNLDQRLSPAHVLLARLEWELGGVPDALDRLKRLLEEDPNNMEAQKLRSEIQDSLRTASGN